MCVRVNENECSHVRPGMCEMNACGRRGTECNSLVREIDSTMSGEMRIIIHDCVLRLSSVSQVSDETEDEKGDLACCHVTAQ